MKTKLYDIDFFKWTVDQAELLKNKEFSKLDIQNLIEEIESLGTSQKSSLKSYLTNLLMHMLKVKYQPEKHTKSWDNTLFEANIMVNEVLKDNPSLKPKLKEILEFSYKIARSRASTETGKDKKEFPEECPWSLKEIFDGLEEKYW